MKATPLEQLLETATGKRALTLGVPRCNPVFGLPALTPDGAAMLMERGIDVRMEAGAGTPIHYTDGRYRAAGARIVTRPEALGCDIVLSPATPGREDIVRMRRGALLLTNLGGGIHDIEGLRMAVQRHIVMLAMDLVADRDGNTPFADIANEVQGRAAMVLAMTIMTDTSSGKGILPGGITGVMPCEVTVLGAGYAGVAAAQSALGMGAMVRIFDTDSYRLRNAARVLGAGAVVSAAHGRAIASALRTADIAIATDKAGCTINSDVAASMKRGAIVMDLDADSRCNSQVFASLRCVDMVTDTAQQVAALIPSDSDTGAAGGPRVCLTNPAGVAPRTLAMGISNALASMFADIVACGGGVSNTLKLHPGMQRAVCTFGGHAVNAAVARALGQQPVDINLLLQFS